MRVVVLGAGVVGVAAAWYLSAAGHDVTVIERQSKAGLETSFANGGQISVSHAEPWANPHVLLNMLKWLGHESSPLLWRLRADAAQWAWGARFLSECRPGRTQHNTIALLRLGLYSRDRLKALRRELALEYDQLERGILHIYTEAKEFDRVAAQTDLMRQYGCDRVVKSAAECLAIEPALTGSVVPLVGGSYTAADESGDAFKFTQTLARHCAAHGVHFRYDCPIDGFVRSGDAVSAVRLVSGEKVCADAYVAALGSYTPQLLKRIGIRIPVYPAKGYSITIPLREGDQAPTVSLTDDAHKLVVTRLGQRLRVAGTAEFNGYDTGLNAVRCNAIATRTFALFPAIAARDGLNCWAGLRPATPSNVPLIGRCRYRNLYLDTGHGTLGWTLACGSGKLLADLVSGCEPEVDPTPYAIA